MRTNRPIIRKVQLTGGGTYVVALPIDWVRKSNLQKGDTIFLSYQPNGSLMLFTKGNEDSGGTIKDIEIDISKVNDKNFIFRLILSKYLMGYKLIKVYHSEGIEEDIREYVTNITANLMGVEIIEETYNRMVLEDLSSHNSLNIDRLVKRTHVLADKMFKTSIEAFIKNDLKKAKEVISQEQSVDRLYYLVSRQLNILLSDFSYASMLNFPLIKVFDYKLVIKRLEAIADHAYSISSLTQELNKDAETKREIMEDIYKVAQEIRNLYNEAMNCFYNHLIAKANEIANAKIDYHQKIHGLYLTVSKLEAKQALPLILVIRSLERISSYSADIAETVINMG